MTEPTPHSSGSCCPPKPEPKTASGCAAPKSPDQQASGSCCAIEVRRADWLLRICSTLAASFYLIAVFGDVGHEHWLGTISHSVQALIDTMWWSVLLAVFFVGALSLIPQNFVLSILGKGGSVRGLFRATAAGVLMDLCSHGILMVGMELRRKGASLGQVMAFLIASPWNSLSLTLIMIALIGLPWTLSFIMLSMLLAITTGWLFDRLEQGGTLPANPNRAELPGDFRFWPEARAGLKTVEWNGELFGALLHGGLSGSRMVVRWLLFGVLLASAIRGFVSLEDFQSWFGPTLLGLLATLAAATVIEVCSEGSTPIAADLMTRANAPGNSFAFLMTGVATDYTEVMVIRDTMKSWKTALFLPLLTVPQVLVVALILNRMAA
jgi:uncharacterized membrane protein YraQ (UPF0718 family)